MAWMAAQNTRPLAYAGVFLFVIAGWVVSLCLHEFGHAYTAWRFGDHDVAARCCSSHSAGLACPVARSTFAPV
jgi:Zn-dependent protease